MAAIQMVDLLRRCQQFHHRLAQHYEELEHTVNREDVRMMLDFMARHERHIEHCLMLYEKTAEPGVAKAWLKVVPDDRLRQLLAECEDDPDMHVEDVIQMAMQFDNALIRMYRQLASSTHNTSLREALESLLDMEEREDRRLAWDLQQG